MSITLVCDSLDVIFREQVKRCTNACDVAVQHVQTARKDAQDEGDYTWTTRSRMAGDCVVIYRNGQP